MTFAALFVSEKREKEKVKQNQNKTTTEKITPHIS